MIRDIVKSIFKQGKKKSDKYTVTLGITPSDYFENNKPNIEILDIVFDAAIGYVKVHYEINTFANTLVLTPQSAMELGFINPYSIVDVITKNR